MTAHLKRTTRVVLLTFAVKMTLLTCYMAAQSFEEKFSLASASTTGAGLTDPNCNHLVSNCQFSGSAVTDRCTSPASENECFRFTSESSLENFSDVSVITSTNTDTDPDPEEPDLTTTQRCTPLSQLELSDEVFEQIDVPDLNVAIHIKDSGGSIENSILDTTESIGKSEQTGERSWYSRLFGWMDAKKKRSLKLLVGTPFYRSPSNDNSTELSEKSPVIEDDHSIGDDGPLDGNSLQNDKSFANRVSIFDDFNSSQPWTHDTEQSDAAVRSHEMNNTTATATAVTQSKHEFFAFLRKELKTNGLSLAAIKEHFLQNVWSPDNKDDNLSVPAAGGADLLDETASFEREDALSGNEDELADTICALEDQLKQKRKQLLSQSHLLQSTVSAPTKVGSKSSRMAHALNDDTDNIHPLRASWPLPGTNVDMFLEEIDLEGIFYRCDSTVANAQPSRNSGTMENAELERRHKQIRRDFGDCSIPYETLKLCGQASRSTDWEIHSGDWHGDVLVMRYKRCPCGSGDNRFWEHVQRLSSVRHENIAMFMGACIEPPNLAIVLSLRRNAVTLHHLIHRRDELSTGHDPTSAGFVKPKLELTTKMQISRQVAQALEFLHAKNIVVAHLYSRNIFVDSKVKVSLTDTSDCTPTTTPFKSTSAPLWPGMLTYLAPELVRCITVSSSLGGANSTCPKNCFSLNGWTPLNGRHGVTRLQTTASWSAETDVFAFGTLLYEIFQELLPFHRVPCHVILWQVANGRRQSLKQLPCTSMLKDLIEDCWSQDPLARPEFTEISRELQMNASLWKRHSSSEPDKLNKIGLTRYF